MTHPSLIRSFRCGPHWARYQSFISKAPPPPTDIKNIHEQPRAASSGHMFEQAHDIIISGGRFYSTAGNLDVDASYNYDTSTCLSNVTHLWHALNQIMLPTNIGKQFDDCGTYKLFEWTWCRNDIIPALETESSHSVVDCLCRCESGLNNQQGQAIQGPILTDQTLIDQVVHDIVRKMDSIGKV